ncbi:Boi2p NDAI_0A01500 [Naumovozyma dairenensis CBS 421]|uniref:Protein BOI2 n=1 Tax=Naumovozyma dairenensis (strain ATCC 10597 / BCRC 20456 / CBS 421 / NBRC 0211 / NRRL Y-12639) TaxID=1071378 RepID=G0W3C0_NAUDC|nr:hypothetical protein NDAI_0A01500 [Naumovozyma dairenensis CBS 421]CCD22308.1 hypothetical protein NDAI_0A01500 [Naumovozyma dairenensis CBS 421]
MNVPNGLPSIITSGDVSPTRIRHVSDSSFNSPISPKVQKQYPMYICINEYSKRMEDELDMRPGDKIEVLTDDEEYNDGWYFGRNLRTGEEGLYPVVFTQIISTERKPTLMRAKSLKRMNTVIGEDNRNISKSSLNDSGSELPTPQAIETAATVSIQKAANKDRTISVKSTMSDIDRALEDFKNDDVPEHSIISSGNATPSLTHGTITSTTDDLDVSDINNKLQNLNLPATSSDELSTIKSKNSSAINGIEASQLKKELAESWSPEEVTAYFILCGFDVQSASKFQQHKISGKILLELELAHLRELDISSFGTRFEIFKEIESIKEAINMAGTQANRASLLMPPAFIDQQQPSNKGGESWKGSQSLENVALRSISGDQSTPQLNENIPKHRPTSLMVENNSSSARQKEQLNIPGIVETIAEDQTIFTSPRRAPKPPSYPSPVQPQSSPSMNFMNSPNPHRQFSPGNLSHSTSMRNISSKSNKNYNIQPQAITRATSINSNPRNISNGQRNRDSVLYTNINKEKHSEDSLNDMMNRISTLAPLDTGDDNTRDNSTIERPTSSIYTASIRDEEELNEPHQQLSSAQKNNNNNRGSSAYFSAHGDTDDAFETNKEPMDTTAASTPTTATTVTATTKKKRSSFVTSPFRQQFTQNALKRTPKEKKQEETTITASRTPLSPLSPSKKKKLTSADDPNRRSVSAKDQNVESSSKAALLEEDMKKRSVSEAVVKGKKTHQVKVRPGMKKQQTSAFVEGIRSISVKEAMKDADYSGWMSKKGTGAMSVWRTSNFYLHGTRLSYFASTSDTKERGLIDITAHRVSLLEKMNKIVSLYAASTGKGRYCFKLVPPQPGSRKGLTFTQPRVHYFAVDNKEDMRGWMATLLKTTIDIDTSVPVISSCATPTVSLSRAQELQSEAREETRLREQQRQLDEVNEEEILWEEQQRNPTNSSKEEQHQNGAKHYGNEESNSNNDGITNSTEHTSEDDDQFSTPNLSSHATTTASANGFASPYFLASGVMSPAIKRNNSTRASKDTKNITESLNNNLFPGNAGEMF